MSAAAIAPFARIVRRETHSPRTVTAIVLASAIILVCAYAGTEIILGMLGQPPLLMTTGNALAWASRLPSLRPLSTVAGGGIVLAVIGLLLMLHASLPGRLARHQMVDDTRAVIVDNGVLASRLARRVETVARIPQGQAVVSVSHRRAIIEVTPTSGIPVDAEAISRTVEEEITSYGLRPRVRHTVNVKKTGMIGS